MLTRTQFNQIINYIISLEERADKLRDGLIEYCQHEDLTGFYPKDISDITLWLERCMNDDDGTISWWLWDCPKRGQANDPSEYTIHHGDAEWVIKTSSNLYDYLMTFYAAAADDEYMNIVFARQNDGIRFALRIIEEMRQNNKDSNNEGYEERDAFLHLVSEKIENSYRLESGCDSDLKENFSLLVKFNNDEPKEKEVPDDEQ